MLDLSPSRALRKVIVRDEARIARRVVDEVARVFATRRIPDRELRPREVVVLLTAHIGDDRPDPDVAGFRIEANVRLEVRMRATVFNPELRPDRDRVVQRRTRLVPLRGPVVRLVRIADRVRGIIDGEAADVQAATLRVELEGVRRGAVLRVVIRAYRGRGRAATEGSNCRQVRDSCRSRRRDRIAARRYNESGASDQEGDVTTH